MTTVHRGEVRDNYEMVVKNLEIFEYFQTQTLFKYCIPAIKLHKQTLFQKIITHTKQIPHNVLSQGNLFLQQGSFKA